MHMPERPCSTGAAFLGRATQQSRKVIPPCEASERFAHV